MKTLTIKEPWCTLIINGYKQYEFRSWKTKYRGKILLHAGMTLEKDNASRFKEYNLNYSKGLIIGEADLTDCIEVTDEFENTLFKENPLVYAKSKHKRKYAWKLENVKKYDKPISIKGKLSLWECKESNMLIHLDDIYYNKIKSGTKTIELRLNDEKRRKLKVGDIIDFENRTTNEILKTEVVKLHLYKDFTELFAHLSKESIGCNIEDLEKFYTKEEQYKYGVVGIEIKLI